jgi:hypothetical protein
MSLLSKKVASRAQLRVEALEAREVPSAVPFGGLEFGNLLDGDDLFSDAVFSSTATRRCSPAPMAVSSSATQAAAPAASNSATPVSGEGSVGPEPATPLAARRNPLPTQTVVAAAPQPAVSAPSMAVGQNIEPVVDFMAAWMFTDAFKQSRPWMTQSYNTVTHAITPGDGGTINTDSNGWPTQLNQFTNAQGQLIQQQLATIMLDGQASHRPLGTYTAHWDGTGTVQWFGDCTVTQTGMTSDGHHFALLNVVGGTAGIQMTITSMSSADPIRNIHVWLPDYNGQSFVGQVWQPGANFSPFHPLFLQRLQGFGTLRFMQAEDIITSQIQHWADRRSVSFETQATDATSFQNGMAPEYMIELCNEMNANLWVNIPHMADNTYIANLAGMIRDTLNPNLKVYIEWSNEVWNRGFGFLPYQWIIQQLALPQNAGVSFEQFVAREFRSSFDVFSQAFAGQTNRLVRVVAGFELNPNYTARVLSNMNGDFDAITVAAYFGPGPSQTATYSASTTEAQIMSDTIASIPVALNFMQQHMNLAQQYSTQLGRPIQLVTYEGGSSLIGMNQPYQLAMNQANADPQMYSAFIQMLTGLRTMGVGLFTNFEYTEPSNLNSPFGLFGSLSYQDQPLADAPKYRALRDFAAPASGVFFTDGNNQLWMFNAQSASFTNTGAFARTFAAGIDALGAPECFFLDGNNQLWRFDNGTFTNTGGFATRISAGEGMVAFADGINQLWTYSDAAGFLNTGAFATIFNLGFDATGRNQVAFLDGNHQLWTGDPQSGGFTNSGGYARQISSGRDAQGNNEVYFLDGNNQVYRLDQGQFTATGAFAQPNEFFGSQGQVFFLDGTNQLWSLNDQTGATDTGAFAQQIGASSGGSAVFFLDGNNQMWEYNNNQVLNTGGFTQKLAAF